MQRKSSYAAAASYYDGYRTRYRLIYSEWNFASFTYYFVRWCLDLKLVSNSFSRTYCVLVEEEEKKKVNQPFSSSNARRTRELKNVIISRRLFCAVCRTGTLNFVLSLPRQVTIKRKWEKKWEEKLLTAHTRVTKFNIGPRQPMTRWSEGITVALPGMMLRPSAARTSRSAAYRTNGQTVRDCAPNTLAISLLWAFSQRVHPYVDSRYLSARPFTPHRIARFAKTYPPVLAKLHSIRAQSHTWFRKFQFPLTRSNVIPRDKASSLFKRRLRRARYSYCTIASIKMRNFLFYSILLCTIQIVCVCMCACGRSCVCVCVCVITMMKNKMKRKERWSCEAATVTVASFSRAPRVPWLEAWNAAHTSTRCHPCRGYSHSLWPGTVRHQCWRCCLH